MRHQIKTIKLGRSQAHRDALIANQIVSLIAEERIKTTLAKAKAVRPFAEKMVTLGKKNTLHARRTALAHLRHNEDAVARLFSEIAPRCAARKGGYTRIIKLGNRNSDAAPMAFLEWVDGPAVVEPAAAPEKKGDKKTKAKSDKTEGNAGEEKKPKAKKATKKEAAAAE
jgi:large subunit ribosomal protein L17